MTTTEKFNTFPPCLVRLLARHRYGRPLTTGEISHAMADPVWAVQTFSHQTAWDPLPLRQSLRFLAACGLDIDDAKAWRRATDYLSKHPTFRYLRNSPDWKPFYLPLMKNWRCSYSKQLPTNLWPPIHELLTRLDPVLK